MQHNRLLIAHLIHRFDIGGLETVLVNLVNNMPSERFDHVIISLTSCSDFRTRITRSNVPVHALDKRPGKDLGCYLRLWRLLRRVRPDIVHTCNIGTLDCQVIAALAGVKHRVHAEHGRDVSDLTGANKKQIFIRRLLRPLFDRVVPVSAELGQWLTNRVGVEHSKVSRIYNGIDTQLFSPATKREKSAAKEEFLGADVFVIGTVGRVQPVKNQVTLVRAFDLLRRALPECAERLRLVVVGDGPLQDDLRRLVDELGLSEFTWCAGAREDVNDILKSFDVFVLSSLVEGIPLTALEAMACAIPVVGTRVGGMPEVVDDGATGALVPVEDPLALANALKNYVCNPELASRHGLAGREKAERLFSLDRMVNDYVSLYDELVGHQLAAGLGS